MDFGFSEDQDAIREAAGRLLDENATLVGAHLLLNENPDGFDGDLWSKLAEGGWLGIGIPEEYGGSGMGAVELAVLAEEIGRTLACIPFAQAMYLVAPAVVQHGSDAQKSALLPAIASGKKIVTAALSENGGIAPGVITAKVSGGLIQGVKSPVPDGGNADVALVAALDDTGQPGLYLVDLTGPGVEREALDATDRTRPMARLTFDGAPADALTGANGAAIKKLVDGAAILVAFEQIGLAGRALAVSSDYAKERKAFGRPIGGFQAIKHRLADMFAKIELARSNAFFGAWALASDDARLAEAAACARLTALDACQYAGEETIQIHGGIGITWIADPHLFVRRGWHLKALLGPAAIWRERLIQALPEGNS
ncbi:MAG: acyl-CoA/acyl-ACP dehydrogenase [Marinosulfonomonas sp.]|nr:acyl-CoA/acyl-ACP dehydrogenase [Marinosulfonomonas sp.]